MAVQTLRIELLGVSFTIQTDESKEYMDAILAHIRLRAQEVQRSTRVTDPLKTSILASVYIVDELFRERSNRGAREADRDELGRAADRLIERLERALSDLEPGPEPGSPEAP